MSRRRRGVKRPPHNALTSSAMILQNDDILNKHLVIQPNEPQKEAWMFYRALGEVQFALGVWLAGCLSRIRLTAAELQPGGDEPTPILDGPIAEMVASLAGGAGGQAAMMKKMAVHLSVPGESYVVAEDPDGTGDPKSFVWNIYSSSELKISKRNPITYQVMEYEGRWRTLTDEYMVCRVWNPDDEFSWKAASPLQSALPILREVDYWNRYILAILMSRLAMNGVWLIPAEASLPVDDRFKDQADPFLAKIVDTASRAIKNPGTAAAAIPMPLKVPADLIEKFKHLTFDTPIGDKVQEHRQAALTRLATSLNVPEEVLTGMKNMNHWGAWQLEESAIKIHISPIAEIICHGLTRGYLEPLAKALGQDLIGPEGGRVVIWYDPTELTQQPDKASEAQAAYDRGEMTAEAFMQASGFEADDIPKMDEFKIIALKKIAMGAGADALQALAALTGDESLVPPPPAPAVPETSPAGASPGTEQGPAGSQPTDQNGPPATRNSPPPPKPGGARSNGVKVLAEVP